ncbi:formyltetrahydrofolate deformylase [Planosporangium flavigriseum]|uniref:Formyltetrahydrofolate deformylase n=1 Tax=Planosporangium flavigriseum TaxID=373681 RepID=A0A8J3PN85_9ACTN|nr:formyltetrahydrofolate deformylase [Planosporangium flavigriseum]NJC66046.1 formyltetrahydrofolate deformylase [Planosporangium flavigriseum]GIG75079.1 formyltetrahydrofolate deformylase [Planosporangium flavigriseum]
MQRRFVLTLSCSDRPGIVHAVTSYLVKLGLDITEHQQFDDGMRGRLFMRTSFVSESSDLTVAHLSREFEPVAAAFGMTWDLYDVSAQPRVLVMVSKFDHCLNDLIYRWRTNSLSGDLVLVVSNHEDLRPMVEAAGLPFTHLPVTPETKPAAEAELLSLVSEYDVDLVVLARYMQILSNELCKELEGRAINIHHSFLPSFAGAKPYHQAYERGVKLVGATAHYVTSDLDEGPIIEQEVIRVDHRPSPDDLVRVGRDAERLALARAVEWHCQRRVLLNGNRTIIFS